MGGVLSCFGSGESLPPICDADLATPGPLKHAYQLFNASKTGQVGKLDSRGFSRAFRLNDDVTLRRLLKLWDRDADGEVDFREFIVGIATWETYERGFGRLRLAFRLLDSDNDNLLGRADLTVAAEAWDRMLAAEGTRASSPTRGGGGGAQQRSVAVPNPFVALQREITETHLQAVDFRAFLNLEPRYPHICTSANLIWSSLQPYAAAAAALVAKLRMEGHMEYLAEPKHLSGKLMRGANNSGSIASQRSSGQSAGGNSGRLAVQRGGSGAPSRNISGASSGGNNSGKLSVPMLSLGGLQPPPPRGHQRTGSQQRVMPGADDDDLDGFAGWAASHSAAVPAGRDGGGGEYGYGEYENENRSEYGGGGGGGGGGDYRARSSAGWAAAPQRTVSPTPPHLRRAASPPLPPSMLPPHAFARSGSSNSLAGGTSARLGSPSRGRLPPAVDPAARTASPMRPPHAQAAPLEPEIRSLMTVLSSPHATTQRTLAQSSNRIPADYYARLNEVAASRNLSRSNTFS